MSHPADPAVRQGIDGDHRREVRRSGLGHGVLRAPAVADPEGADLTVRPGLSGDPLDDVVAVRRVVGHHPPGAFTGVSPAHVVGHHDIATLGVATPVGRRPRLVVGGTSQERWEPAGDGLIVAGRPIQIGRQLRAVAGGNEDVGLDHHVELRISLCHLGCARPALRKLDSKTRDTTKRPVNRHRLIPNPPTARPGLRGRLQTMCETSHPA